MTRPISMGPLSEYEDGLRRVLTGAGYSQDTIRAHVRLLAELGAWLEGHQLDPSEVSAVVARFAADRRERGLRTGRSERAFAPILDHLANEGVLAEPSVVGPVTWQEELLAEYGAFLEGERAASAGTVKHYRRCARQFL
jgi:integrase/recombinase XerD